MVHPEQTLHPQCSWTFSQSWQATPILGQNISDAQSHTKLPLIPNDYRSGIQIGSHIYRLNISVWQTSKKYPINSLVCMKSLHSLHPFCHSWLLDSLCAVHPVFHSNGEPAAPNPFPIRFNPHAQSLLMMNRIQKSPKSSTPRLTTDAASNYVSCLLDRVLRALTKKLPGSSLPNSDMLLNSLWISTLPIQPSLVLCQISDLGGIHFIWILLEVFTFL